MEYYWNRTEGWLTILTSCQQHPVMSWTWTRHWQHMCRLDSITSQCHETTVDFLKIGMSWKWKSYPETKITPENWWLEDDPFLLGCHLFRGELCVSLEGNQHSTQELAAPSGIRSRCHWQGGKVTGHKGGQQIQRQIHAGKMVKSCAGFPMIKLKG